MASHSTIAEQLRERNAFNAELEKQREEQRVAEVQFQQTVLQTQQEALQATQEQASLTADTAAEQRDLLDQLQQGSEKISEIQGSPFLMMVQGLADLVGSDSSLKAVATEMQATRRQYGRSVQNAAIDKAEFDSGQQVRGQEMRVAQAVAAGEAGDVQRLQQELADMESMRTARRTFIDNEIQRIPVAEIDKLVAAKLISKQVGDEEKASRTGQRAQTARDNAVIRAEFLLNKTPEQLQQIGTPAALAQARAIVRDVAATDKQTMAVRNAKLDAMTDEALIQGADEGTVTSRELILQTQTRDAQKADAASRKLTTETQRLNTVERKFLSSTPSERDVMVAEKKISEADADRVLLLDKSQRLTALRNELAFTAEQTAFVQQRYEQADPPNRALMRQANLVGKRFADETAAKQRRQEMADESFARQLKDQNMEGMARDKKLFLESAFTTQVDQWFLDAMNNKGQTMLENGMQFSANELAAQKKLSKETSITDAMNVQLVETLQKNILLSTRDIANAVGLPVKPGTSAEETVKLLQSVPILDSLSQQLLNEGAGALAQSNNQNLDFDSRVAFGQQAHNLFQQAQKNSREQKLSVTPVPQQPATAEFLNNRTVLNQQNAADAIADFTTQVGNTDTGSNVFNSFFDAVATLRRREDTGKITTATEADKVKELINNEENAKAIGKHMVSSALGSLYRNSATALGDTEMLALLNNPESELYKDGVLTEYKLFGYIQFRNDASVRRMYGFEQTAQDTATQIPMATYQQYWRTKGTAFVDSLYKPAGQTNVIQASILRTIFNNTPTPQTMNNLRQRTIDGINIFRRRVIRGPGANILTPSGS